MRKIIAHGAFVVSSKDVFDYKLKVVPETLKEGISSLLDTIDSKVDDFSSAINDIDKFVQFIEHNPSKRSAWFDADLLIVSSIVQKN